MPSSNRLFDDLARLMTDAAGAAQGVRREAETVVRAQLERVVRDLDIASREELDVLRDLVTNLQAQNAALTAIMYRRDTPPALVTFNDAAHLTSPLRWTGFPTALRPAI